MKTLVNDNRVFKMKRLGYSLVDGEIRTAKGKEAKYQVTDGVVVYKIPQFAKQKIGRWIAGIPSIVGMLVTGEWENGFLFANLNGDIDNVDVSGICKIPIDELETVIVSRNRECFRYGNLAFSQSLKQLETEIIDGRLFICFQERKEEIPISNKVIKPYLISEEHLNNVGSLCTKMPVRGYKPYTISSSGILYKDDVRVIPEENLMGEKYITYRNRKVPLEKLVLMAWDDKYHMEPIRFIDENRIDKYHKSNLEYTYKVKYYDHTI